MKSVRAIANIYINIAFVKFSYLELCYTNNVLNKWYECNKMIRIWVHYKQIGTFISILNIRHGLMTFKAIQTLVSFSSGDHIKWLIEANRADLIDNISTFTSKLNFKVFGKNKTAVICHFEIPHYLVIYIILVHWHITRTVKSIYENLTS